MRKKKLKFYDAKRWAFPLCLSWKLFHAAHVEIKDQFESISLSMAIKFSAQSQLGTISSFYHTIECLDKIFVSFVHLNWDHQIENKEIQSGP